MGAQAASIPHSDVGDIRLSFFPDGVNRMRPMDVYAGSDADVCKAHSQHSNLGGWLVISLGSLLIETRACPQVG